MKTGPALVGLSGYIGASAAVPWKGSQSVHAHQARYAALHMQQDTLVNSPQCRVELYFGFPKNNPYSPATGATGGTSFSGAWYRFVGKGTSTGAWAEHFDDALTGGNPTRIVFFKFFGPYVRVRVWNRIPGAFKWFRTIAPPFLTFTDKRMD